MRTGPLIAAARGALALALALSWAGSVQAKTCTITGNGVAFGVYDPTSAANVDTIGSVDFECDGKFNGTLKLGVGTGVGASFSGGRNMTRAGGGSTLRYNLYANATRTQVFGDGTGGSVTLNIDANKTFNQKIWGRAPGGQNTVLAGVYGDVVVVTFSY